MEHTDAFAGLECLECGTVADPEATTHRCPNCGGILEATYDYDAVSLERLRATDVAIDSMWRFEDLLPFPREAAVTTAEGATPLVECPNLAAELEVDRVLVKDEGRNPTGTSRDRELSVATTAAVAHGATEVALASTGDGGQSAAAYAGRTGLESHVFVPARAAFATKAMVNVHGGDMTVVGGRCADARAAAQEALAEHEDWYALDPFATPYRREGQKTLLYEICAALEWEAPDVVVQPTGSGVGLAGLAKGARELLELGAVDDAPALYAAQAAGCAPVVDAFEAGRDVPEPIEHPDTICGGIEIPDPEGGSLALEAVRETGGAAVAAEDDAILEAAVTVASAEGLEMTPSGAASAAGAWELAERGAFDGDETVVLVNTGSGNKAADVLRSHLMGQGM